jgi:hypothetical protein
MGLRWLRSSCSEGAQWRRRPMDARVGSSQVVVAGAVALVLAAALAGCGDHHERSRSSASLARSGRPDLSARREGSPRYLACGQYIGTGPPTRGMRVVLGVVALPATPSTRRALQASPSTLRDPAARLFAKQGLVIRTATRFRLIVPDRFRDRLSIAWGSTSDSRRASTFAVNGCAGPSGVRWLAYAGGYYVRDPMCAPLIVEAGDQRRRVQIGIGKACPGERTSD